MFEPNTMTEFVNRRHQELIEEAANIALANKVRRQNRRPNRRVNHVLVALTHLLTRS